MNRWRGRLAGLAIAALVLVATAAAIAFGRSPATAWQLVVRGADAETLVSVPLPDRRFTLRYRHSVYDSLAEERFVVGSDGQMQLVELASDEAAVLDEYYATTRLRPAAAGDPRRWLAEPYAPLRLDQLPLAATQRGQRTLVVGGREIALWQLSAAGTAMVVLEAEQAR
jgi:hypothetical protein